MKKYLYFLNSFWLISIVICSLVIIITYHDLPKYHGDQVWYIKIASNQLNEVVKPFSNRILYPKLGQTVSQLTNFDLKNSFILLNILSLLVFVTAIMFIFKKFKFYPSLGFFVIVSPLLIYYFEYCYLPELFYSSIVALFFLCLINDNFLISMVILFLLMLTRDNTLLLSLILITVLWYKDYKKWIPTFICVTLIGLITASIISMAGKSDIHGLGYIIYLFFKVPYNILTNYCGITLWSNTLALNNPWWSSPIFFMTLPKWFHFGGITEIGIYKLDIHSALSTLIVLISLFGVLPSLLFWLLKKYSIEVIYNSPTFIAVALIYGVLSYFLGPAIGGDVVRLVSYGWPAFWIATPILLLNYCSLSKMTACKITTYHVIVSWLPWLLADILKSSILFCLFFIGIGGTLHFLSLKEIKKATVRV